MSPIITLLYACVLHSQVGRNEKQWKQWFDKEAPENEVIPDGYNNSLDVFRRLILVRSWAPDRTMSQARNYIADSLGEKFAEGVILDLEKMWYESDNRTPLVGLLSMGSDPTSGIEALAKKHKIGKSFFYQSALHFNTWKEQLFILLCHLTLSHDSNG